MKSDFKGFVGVGFAAWLTISAGCSQREEAPQATPGPTREPKVAADQQRPSVDQPAKTAVSVSDKTDWTIVCIAKRANNEIFAVTTNRFGRNGAYSLMMPFANGNAIPQMSSLRVGMYMQGGLAFEPTYSQEIQPGVLLSETSRQRKNIQEKEHWEVSAPHIGAMAALTKVSDTHSDWRPPNRDGYIEDCQLIAENDPRAQSTLKAMDESIASLSPTASESQPESRSANGLSAAENTALERANDAIDRMQATIQRHRATQGCEASLRILYQLEDSVKSTWKSASQGQTPDVRIRYLTLTENTASRAANYAKGTFCNP